MDTPQDAAHIDKSIVPGDAPEQTRTPASTERRPEQQVWVQRALFESALILLGILGGFAVNEWQADRERTARLEAGMRAVRAELQANLASLRESTTYTRELVGKFRALSSSGATVAPTGTYPRGLVMRPRLVAAAWESMRMGDVTARIPADTLLALARTYETQRDYLDSSSALRNLLYAGLFERPGSPLDFELLAGILNDYAGRGGGLLREYEATLAHVDRAP